MVNRACGGAEPGERSETARFGGEVSEPRHGEGVKLTNRDCCVVKERKREKVPIIGVCLDGSI